MVWRLALPAALAAPRRRARCSSFSRADRPKDQTPLQQDHITWVAETVRRMLAVKAGMTRAGLLQVFNCGGLSGAAISGPSSVEICSYFKVDLEFQGGRRSRAQHGRVTATHLLG
jgi:hypothetical protein